jgi:ribosomal protein S15P/S13E
MQKKISAESGKAPEKIRVSADEFRKKVAELAEQGLTSEKIGERLRKEGIHPREFGEKISRIMGGRYEPPDILNIQKKLKGIEGHISKNRQDKRAIREKDRIVAQLRKMKEYQGMH